MTTCGLGGIRTAHWLEHGPANLEVVRSNPSRASGHIFRQGVVPWPNGPDVTDPETKQFLWVLGYVLVHCVLGNVLRGEEKQSTLILSKNQTRIDSIFGNRLENVSKYRFLLVLI